MSDSDTVLPIGKEAYHFDDEAIRDMKLRLKVLTGMDTWTKRAVARRALSLLKDDLADRLKEAGKWEEYQEKADSLSKQNTETEEKN